MNDLEMRQNALGLLKASGVNYSQAPNTIPVGADRVGNPLYFSKDAAMSTNSGAGATFVGGLQALLHPTGVLTDDDHKALNEISLKSRDQKLISELDTAANHSNKDTFTGKVLQGLGASDDPQLAVSAEYMGNAWGKMSPAQKSLSLASIGLQGHKFPDGSNIYNKDIIPSTNGSPPLKTGQALSMLSNGINIYPLISKWDQHLTLEKLAGGHDVPQEVAIFSNQNGLLGTGIHGAEVPSITKDSLMSKGFKDASQYGPGAILGNPNSDIPKGYVPLYKSNAGTILAPKGTASMGEGALDKSLIGTAGGTNGVSSSAFNLYKSWSPKDIAYQDAAGGSALLSGLIGLAKTNPFVFSGNNALSTFKNVKDIPQDNLKYVTAMSGISLNRLKNGSVDQTTDKEGLNLVSSLVGNNFPSQVLNLRKLYAENGITSKADAYQLANQAYGEKRFNESELVAAHQVFNMIFDPVGTGGANKLVLGRDRAKAVMSSMPNLPTNSNKISSKLVSKEDMKAKNQATYGAQAG